MLFNASMKYITSLIVLGIFLVGVVSLKMRSYTSIFRNSQMKSYKSKLATNIKLFSVLTTFANLTSGLTRKVQQVDARSFQSVIEAPKLSKWEFKQLRLKNGLLVTLVHDGESEKSRCVYFDAVYFVLLNTSTISAAVWALL